MGIGTRFGPGKPAEGQPCNGCGICCEEEPCGIAVELIEAPHDRPCPAMEFVDGRFRCGLMLHPTKYIDGLNNRDVNPAADEILGRIIADAIGAGKGCDSDAPPTTFGAENVGWDGPAREGE